MNQALSAGRSLTGWYVLPSGTRMMVDTNSLQDDSYRLIRIGDRPVVVSRETLEEMIAAGRLTRVA